MISTGKRKIYKPKEVNVYTHEGRLYVKLEDTNLKYSDLDSDFIVLYPSNIPTIVCNIEVDIAQYFVPYSRVEYLNKT